MVNNFTNIKKTNIYLLPQIIEQKADHIIMPLKIYVLMGIGTKMWQG